MNKNALHARIALAHQIRDRHNPPYRIVTADGEKLSATTREDARNVKRSTPSASHIEQRVASDLNSACSYQRIR